MGVSVPTPEEFRKPSNLSWAAVAYIAVLCFFIGFGSCAFIYALAEVDGVRKDMDKEDKHLNDQIQEVRNYVDEQIKDHNQNRDAHK